MVEAGHQGLVGLAAADLAGGRQGPEGEAVVALVAGQDLVAVLPGVALALALAGDLEGGLVGLGAAVGVEGAGQPSGQQLRQPRRQPRRRLVDLRVRVERQALQLLEGGLGDLLAAVADVDVPQPAAGVEIGPSLGVVEGAALAALEDEERVVGAAGSVLKQGMPAVVSVEPLQLGGVECRHGISVRRRRRRMGDGGIMRGRRLPPGPRPPPPVRRPAARDRPPPGSPSGSGRGCRRPGSGSRGSRR